MDNTNKRKFYSDSEKQLFWEILLNDANAKKFILNKGVIRAQEKNELYIRLTDLYNSR